MDPENQRLVVGGKEMRDDDKILQDYDDIKNYCTVFLVVRMPGGEDECLICCNQRVLLKAPCKCSKAIYCTDCIIRDIKYKVNYNNAKLVCPYCEKEWDLIQIQKAVGMNEFSDADFNAVSKKMSQNYINREPGIRECPGCQSYCIREDQTKNKFYCLICAMENKQAEYCFQCSLPWKNDNSFVDCGNQNCESANPLSLLPKASRKEIGTIENCPSLRMCPGCAAIIEHEDGCNMMHCEKCGTDFCFICLTLDNECESYSDTCTAAPIQTTIPTTFHGDSGSYRCLANM